MGTELVEVQFLEVPISGHALQLRLEGRYDFNLSYCCRYASNMAATITNI